MLDLQSISLMLGGTLLATFLQAGWRNSGICLAELASLLKRGFDAGRIKAELAQQIADLKKDGLVRARQRMTGDAEFDNSTSALLQTRSIDAMLHEHDTCRSTRFARATTARQVCHQAAELAQVLGLAGTLLSLGGLGPMGELDGGIAAAIGMAVTTTLCGVLLANLLFVPLAGLVERRSRAEDEAREDVFQWLQLHANIAAPRLNQEEYHGHENHQAKIHRPEDLRPEDLRPEDLRSDDQSKGDHRHNGQGREAA